MDLPTGRRKPGRPYCEAFPMLDIHDLLRAAGADRVFPQWEDEDGLILGFLSRQALSEDSVTFFWRLFGTRNVEAGQGQEVVATVRRMAGKYWRKPSFVCPQCARQVTRLYYVHGRWACKQSHDLLNLVQRLDPVNKAMYYRDNFKVEPLTGLETAAELRKRERAKLKYGKAVSDLQGGPEMYLPDQFRHRAIGRWLAPGEEPKLKVGRDEVGYGWMPGMSGQFDGLELPARRVRATGERRWAGRPLASKRLPEPSSEGVRSSAPLPDLEAMGSARAPGFRDPLAMLDLGLFDPLVIPDPTVMIEGLPFLGGDNSSEDEH